MADILKDQKDKREMKALSQTNEETEMTNANSEADIRQTIEARANAARKGDVDAIMANVSSDAMVFDVVDPLRQWGKLLSRERASAWVGSYDGPIGLEVRDLQISVDGEVAFSHALSHVTGTLKTTAKVDMWFRTTLGLRRIEGRWLIVHDHGSVAFDPKSGKVSLALKP